MKSTTDPAAEPPDDRRPVPATIYDIAREAGVSPSTVSRALNKPGRISPVTEQRVRATAEALGYRGNPLARALLTGRTRTLGLILSDITNPVYFDLVRGVERVAAGAGFTLVLAETQESADIEREGIERVLPAVDGLILVASRLPDDAIREIATRKRVALVNRRVEGVPAVVPDVAAGIREGLEHLRLLGHRHVAFLSGPTRSWMSALRCRLAFEEAARTGMSIVEIGPADPTLEGGSGSRQRVLASGATAVLAYNDLMAIGLLLACRDAGIDVPGRLSLMGFDDIFGSSFTSPPLTTVRSPLGPLGERAAQLLIGGDGPGDEPLVTRLVVRGSTGAPADEERPS